MSRPVGRRRAVTSTALLLAALGTTSCLPGDERPEPGRLFVTAEPNDATREGFTTPDGWTVRLERFVTSVGQIRLSEDSCNAYGEPHYTWLFDFAVAGRAKAGLIYARGDCSMEFDFRWPGFDSPLGPGATVQDREFMRIRGSDAYATDQPVSLIVRGAAARGPTTKRFDWLFRHRYELTDCPATDGEGLVSHLELQGGDELQRRIVVRAEELFRSADFDEAPLHFDAFAEADADGDDRLTFAELADVPAPDATGLGAGGAAPAPPAGEDLSLADLVYERLLGRIMLLDGGGTCEAELEN
ncbi:MAG: hypothetical protein JRI23_33310 [Deltaproteobacteria bacterium]|jgi:hypothetical protein|nr:hypothetical protein [Deltaproteobacteria bacterium]MBW2537157.1 hypothetical protein [Deltaproteobacteria bacterium]